MQVDGIPFNVLNKDIKGDTGRTQEGSEAVVKQQETAPGAIDVTSVGAGLDCDVKMLAKINKTI